MQGVFLVVECKHNPPTNCAMASIICSLEFHDALIVTKKRKPQQIKGLIHNFYIKGGWKQFSSVSSVNCFKDQYTTRLHQVDEKERQWPNSDVLKKRRNMLGANLPRISFPLG